MSVPNHALTNKDDILIEAEGEGPAVAYLFEEQVGPIQTQKPGLDDFLVFQYWPESVSDSYAPNYSDIPIPGGSHPLYQYIGGGERSIGFQAFFTCEVNVPSKAHGTESSKYTVDIVAAMARIDRYLYPRYRTGSQLGVTEAPPKLVLVMPNMNLGHDHDEVRVILKGAPKSYTHWFPDGTPRIVTVDFEFAEIVQTRQQVGTKIEFVSSDRFITIARRYNLGTTRLGETIK